MHNLFFVNSPLQILCSVEAIEHFKTENNILVFFNQGEGKTHQQMLNVFEQFRNKFKALESIERELKSVRGWLKAFKRINEIRIKYPKVKGIFVGDYRSGIVRHFCNTVSYEKIILIDDGFATIMTDYFIKNKNYSNFRDKIKYILSLFRYKYKMNYDVCSFTIFHDYSKSDCIINNTFQNLVSNFEWKLTDHVYWLGSPAAENGKMSEVEYFTTLEKWMSKIESTIIYFPHRRESEKKLNKMKNDLGVIVTRTNLPIELYVLNNSEKPKAVISFHSTALFTLKKILVDIPILYITQDSKVFKEDFFYKSVYEVLNNETLHITELQNGISL